MIAYLRIHQKQFLSSSENLLQLWLSVLGKQNSANKILLILTAYLEKKKVNPRQQLASTSQTLRNQNKNDFCQYKCSSDLAQCDACTLLLVTLTISPPEAATGRPLRL